VSRRARPAARTLRLAATGLCLVVLGGCARGCTSPRPPIHLNPNMDDQPRLTAQQASGFFYDGAAMRPPIEGTVALGDPVEIGPLETGRAGDAPDAPFVAAIPPEASAAFDVPLAVRGEERYGIYCTPCHGDRGDGQGTLRQRSGVASADLRLERLHAAPDGQLFDTITHGLGLMAGYAAQIPVADRWAIVAHVRELQAASPPVPEAAAVPAGEGATGGEGAPAGDAGPPGQGIAEGTAGAAAQPGLPDDPGGTEGPGAASPPDPLGAEPPPSDDGAARR